MCSSKKFDVSVSPEVLGPKLAAERRCKAVMGSEGLQRRGIGGVAEDGQKTGPALDVEEAVLGAHRGPLQDGDVVFEGVPRHAADEAAGALCRVYGTGDEPEPPLVEGDGVVALEPDRPRCAVIAPTTKYHAP